VAHDIGATVAQPLARRHPDLVAGLVLLDPPYPGIGRRRREPAHVREIWPAWVTETELRHYVDAYSQPGALRGGFHYYRARERTRTSEGEIPPGELPVPVPTRVLWGEADPILPVAWADRLPEYFPQLTLARVPGVGHFMMRVSYRGRGR